MKIEQKTKIEKIESFINEINKKKSTFYFTVMNPTNQASGAITHVYEMANRLVELGYDAKILHDREYEKPFWVDEHLSKLEHILFNNLIVKPSDFLFLSEVMVSPFFNDLKQSKKTLACEIIIISQTYDLIFHTLGFNEHWKFFNVRNVITTTKKQERHINDYMKGLDISIVTPFIPEYFKKSNKPTKPFISIFTRNPKDADKLYNKFKRKYPHLAWITFKFVSSMTRESMAKEISESFLTVWLDDMSSFGTLPLEAMKCGVPVIGKIPEMIPEWMESFDGERYGLKNNGLWVSSKQIIPDAIAEVAQEFLIDVTDTNKSKIKFDFKEMTETSAKYTKELFNSQLNVALDNVVKSSLERLEHLKAKEIENQQNTTKTPENVK